MKIKICGLRRREDIEGVNLLLPDYIGFVFADTKRKVTPREASGLKGLLDPRIRAVGVFVEEDIQVIARLLREGVIDAAQLHGRESEEQVRQLRELTGAPVFKAVKVRSPEDVRRWEDSQADLLLFDNGQGTGRTFDWTCLPPTGRDFFLAGGLTPENVGEAIERFHPWGVDVSTGVETDGYKDFAKMKQFVETVRNCG